MVTSTQSASEWGLCEDCKWWQIEPKAQVDDETLGHCIEERLQPYVLRVSGNSGCNHFANGDPARAAGASEALLTDEPTR